MSDGAALPVSAEDMTNALEMLSSERGCEPGLYCSIGSFHGAYWVSFSTAEPYGDALTICGQCLLHKLKEVAE